MPKLSDDMDVTDAVCGFHIALAKTIHQVNPGSQIDSAKAFADELEVQLGKIENLPMMRPRAVSFLRTLVGDLQSALSQYQPR